MSNPNLAGREGTCQTYKDLKLPSDDVLKPLSYVWNHGYRGDNDEVHDVTDPKVLIAATLFDLLS